MTTEPVPLRPAKRHPHPEDLAEHATNVSKRSVERLYYPKVPSYLRHFVKKPQRRSALTNRCHWLRLKVIDAITRQFLERPSATKKIVVDLGCGSDVLPWKCNFRYPEACKDALFIDVQNPDLLRKKRTTILDAPQLRELLGPDFSTSETEDDPVYLKSPKYYQVACEPSDLKCLQATLDSIISTCPENREVLFLAEDSLEYLEQSLMDDLLKWASSVGKSEFCLMEPIIPCGPDHPFASVIRSHRELNDRSHLDERYPTVNSQSSRFTSAGWNHVRACDLWEAWVGGKLATRNDCIELNAVEPFDDWEDFIMWCRHHVLVHATTDAMTPARKLLIPESVSKVEPTPTIQEVELRLKPPKKAVRRSFGGMAVLEDFEGHRNAMHLFGSDAKKGLDKCLDTYDIYSSSSSPMKLPLEGPPSRVCFTLTDLGDYGHLLVGGRKDSGKACADCWVLRKGILPSWERVWDLPVPVFRHSTVRLKGTSLALLLGGKTSPTEFLCDAFVFHPIKGWLRCKYQDRLFKGPSLRPIFGASLVGTYCSVPSEATFGGFLFGGLSEKGDFGHGIQNWTLRLTADEPELDLNPRMRMNPNKDRLSVFGAQAVVKDGSVMVLGGMGAMSSVQGQTVSWLTSDEVRPGTWENKIVDIVPLEELCTWPLMIGHSAVSNQRTITIFNGGTTLTGSTGAGGFCSFSYDDLDDVPDPSRRPLEGCYESTESPKILPQTKHDMSTPASGATATITNIPRVSLNSKDDIQRLLRDGKPVIIQGLHMGECVERWTPSYMTGKVGHDQEVVVHECKGTGKMDFNSKNFQYITDTFANIMTRIEAGGKLYLRSLSNSKPSEAPANLKEDYPGLAEDFKLPEEVVFVQENLFSSILRISGRVNMWLHYDVMANIYTQIRGSKRMILFPPSDVSYLSFAPGASSSSLDVFSALDTPALSQTHPHEANLQPGDILLLPPMWFHTATPTSDMSVAVNVFFRDLDNGYSEGRDVYGNRDLAPYEKARQDAARIGKSFDKLPTEIRRFYLARIADELRGMAEEG